MAPRVGLTEKIIANIKLKRDQLTIHFNSMQRILDAPAPNYNNLRARIEKIKLIFTDYENGIIELRVSNTDHELVPEIIEFQDRFFEFSTCCPNLPS